MNARNRITTAALWVNRFIILLIAVLCCTLQLVIGWYCQFRTLLETEKIAITVAFYCCAVFVFAALWNMDRLLTAILAEKVFIRKNVTRIRRIQWCCGLVSLICIPATFAYLPLIFMVVIMAFLCLTVCVVTRVMDAAVAIREENDLTI